MKGPAGNGASRPRKSAVTDRSPRVSASLGVRSAAIATHSPRSMASWSIEAVSTPRRSTAITWREASGATASSIALNLGA